MIDNLNVKKVLITGILGQDGSNMAEFLLNETDCYVYGMMRRSANPNYINTLSFRDHERFNFVFGDLTDEVSINNLIIKIGPDYLINFAANSFVGISWEMPMQVFDVNTLGVLRCLEAVKKYSPKCRIYSAGSSEEFGDVDYSPQDLKHPIKPRSPYGASKASARHLIKVYRESYNMYAVHGILFNHEGIRRGEEFVSRKITKGAARIAKSIKEGRLFSPLELGNIDSKRDFSNSKDIIKGVWLMLNQSKPKDYLLASGETHSIREFVEKAFYFAGVKGYWNKKGVEEEFCLGEPCGEEDINYANVLVKINPMFYRPAEVDVLMGDPRQAIEELGWKPSGSFDLLVKEMVEYDVAMEYK